MQDYAGCAGGQAQGYLSLRNVRKSYGSNVVLPDVNLDIARGEFVTLLGASGSGKSTLLQIIAGFEQADAGVVALNGEDLAGVAAHKRDFGMVFQSYALFPNMDVSGNVAYPLRVRGVGREEIARRVGDALALMHLETMARRRIDQLSGGQRQRVALARAIVFQPRVLLMDEPLSALDKKMREEMQVEIRQVHEQTGMTTVFVTHDQREALTMSDRIVVLDRGRIAQVDTPSRVYLQPANRFVADFIGEATFLPVALGADGVPAFAGAPVQTDQRLDRAAGELWIAVRPEKLRIMNGDHSGAGVNTFRATVRSAVFQGESSLVTARLADGQDIMLRVQGGATHLAVGQPVVLGLRREDTVIVAS